MRESRHILLVEDHAPMRWAVAELIEADERLDVLAAVESAEEALELVDSSRSDRVDLAVVDLNLPGMHGLELVAELERRTPGVPVIVLSSHSSERYAPVAKDAGAEAYIEKIRTTTDLVKTVRELLGIPAARHRPPHSTVPLQSGLPDDPEAFYESGHPVDDRFDAVGGPHGHPARHATGDWLPTT